MELTAPTLILLSAVAMLAGFVDAIAGGGGLLTVPALLLAGLPPHLALGTNKGQSVFGSGMALIRFAHSPLLDRTRAVRSFVPALLGAAGGTGLVLLISPQALAPVILVLLTGVAVFMIFYRPPREHRPTHHRGWPTTIAVAAGIAAYDGFFGPGTGTFLILAYVLLFHDPLDAASANAKVVNFASNLAALAIFASRGVVIWQIALPMAVGQAMGGFLGAHLTVRAGRGLVRYAVVAVSLGLLAKLAWGLAGH